MKNLQMTAMTRGRYDAEDAYDEVVEMIDDNQATKDEYIDSNFNEATYLLGMSAKREANILGWHGGQTIHLTDDITEAEIRFLQDNPYNTAVLIL